MVLFRLAEKQGHADPYALGRTIPAALLKEWVVYWGARAELEHRAVESARHK